MIPAIVDHAAACGCTHLPTETSARARRADADQTHAHSHAAAIARLVARAAGARGAQQARLAVRCLYTRLDAGGAAAAAPLLHLLLGLLDCARAPQGRGGVEAARGAISDAVMDSPMLLEVLQELYSQTAWHLPMAEMLAKLKGEGSGRVVRLRSCATRRCGRVAYSADPVLRTFQARPKTGPNLLPTQRWASWRPTSWALATTATRPPAPRPPPRAPRCRRSLAARCGGRWSCRGCRCR